VLALAELVAQQMQPPLLLLLPENLTALASLRRPVGLVLVVEQGQFADKLINDTCQT
jgi:hypothetical protein